MRLQSVELVRPAAHNTNVRQDAANKSKSQRGRPQDPPDSSSKQVRKDATVIEIGRGWHSWSSNMAILDANYLCVKRSFSEGHTTSHTFAATSS